MATKFIRGMIYNTGSTTARASYLFKFMYEFWGFPIYGGPSLVAPGGFSGSTTIAVTSNGVALPTGTINVLDTTGFATSGSAYIYTSAGSQLVTYTGKTATTLTGCTGGTGTMSTGGTVNSTAYAGGSLPGNFNGVGTTIAAASNGQSLPQATITVANTTGFPASGTIFVYTTQGTQTVTYTGTTATTFTGCSGGLGTMSTGNNVTSSSLMTIGTDGYTNATTVFRMDGYTDFYSTSAPFTSNMVGKILTMWKPGSNSSEDSCYNIIAFKSPSNIVINVNNGGTPSGPADGYRPTVTTRSSINFRVVDVATAATATGIADGNYLVFQLDPTGVNAGQANSQVQFLISTTNQRLDFRMSPNGSWTGSVFGVDASGTLTLVAQTTASFFSSATSGQLISINLFGDKSFLISHFKDSFSTGSGSVFHMEIPERLYTAAQDPNPLIVMMTGYNTTQNLQFNSTVSTHSYGGGFNMRCNDGVYRLYRVLAKATTGDGNAAPGFSGIANVADTFGNSLQSYDVAITPVFGSVMSSQAILCLPAVAGQFSLARVRLRTIRFSNSVMPIFTRFDSNGDFIQLTTGVAVLWDKTVLPLTLFAV